MFSSDIFGEALIAFKDTAQVELVLNNSYGKPEPMPLDIFFRTEDELSLLEARALELCEGHILDVGAGAGALSLILQNRGRRVTSLEISQGACLLMHEAGLNDIRNEDIYLHKGQYDTMLLMMNGIGISGDITGLESLLSHMRDLLKEGGQILLDSSDISYLYKRRKIPTDRYYGEISYQYEWQGKTGPWFKWLYIDDQLLREMAARTGFSTELIYSDGMDQYLARLTLS